MSYQTHILSIGSALPGPPIDNATLCKSIGVQPEWIDLYVGTRTRYFGVDIESGRQTHSLADMAASAASQAMSRADITPAEIGFLVLSTATPDHLMPTSANLVADALGLDRIPTFQVQSGCSGAIAAFELGGRLLDESRPIGLVIGADTCTKHLRLDRDVISAMSPSELINLVLFGDGAGAAVLSISQDGAQFGVTALINRFCGLGREPGQQIDWFGLADRHLDQPGVNEDYKAIERWVPRLSRDVLTELIADAGIARCDLDYLLPPQLSGHMTERVVKQMEPAEHSLEISVVADTGNNGNALPFLQLDALATKARSGQLAAVVTIESSKWIEGGMVLESVT
ncbi:3-oxoacyl-ACP synthase III family protein [Mycobacterium montefiorense]|uniref:3-oxoacyl-ACP synthase III family protein n=1 Tax=Mycobacterium montefiorense TaxID=154654 RepID=UPI0021F2757A|nr:3-oxoacyl-ACP synthase III family protein [Mycobacterium montefiorense]MCV7426902.1 3-oxoacyl-ACP synthase III family protein [Mycobacterium montefiorense]GLE52457.1 3-oxoacyl-[acyl-carrier-protein] synthase III [Mycobacterium montefiorense]